MADRTDLINQLAASMGVASGQQYESRFDATTGTLYCNGMSIGVETAEKAIRYFEMMAKRCNPAQQEQREMIKIYQCAISAIRAVQDPEVKNLLKEKVTK